MWGKRLSIIVLFSVCLFGCKFRKIQKNGDWMVKYEAALEYYENEDYHRTTILLEEILPIIRGTKEAELGNFRFAYSYFYQRQYILSAHHFQEFATVYGRSEYVMEAEYMHAYSLYLQSPDYQLDQTSTYEAIAAMQSFINKYPSSEYAVEADKIIDEMQVKLETKAYHTAKLYYKLRRYESAMVAFDNFKDDYPDSDYNEELAFLNIEVSYEFASNSIQNKQEERFRKTVEFYENFVDKYPSGAYLKDAEKFYSKSIEEITNFASSK